MSVYSFEKAIGLTIAHPIVGECQLVAKVTTNPIRYMPHACYTQLLGLPGTSGDTLPLSKIARKMEKGGGSLRERGGRGGGRTKF